MPLTPTPGPAARTPGQLLGFIPHGLGIQPDSSLVLITVRGEQDGPRNAHVARVDLPAEGTRAAAAVTAGRALDLIRRKVPGAWEVTAAAYGPPAQAMPVTDALRTLAPEAGIELTDLVRVDSGWYWSCLRPSPVGGHPVLDPPPAVAAGLGPVYPTKAALAAHLREPSGTARHAVEADTRRAEDRLRQLARSARTPAAAAREIAAQGITAVTAAIERYRSGADLPGSALARLAVLLQDQWVQCDAHARMDPAYTAAHSRLWTDVTRNALGAYAAAPAGLLAFTALQAGREPVARIALTRTTEAAPGAGGQARTAADLDLEVSRQAIASYQKRPGLSPAAVASRFDASLRAGDTPGHPILAGPGLTGP